jgi:LysR family nitrogen assimilation transcriptional regulator
MGTKFMDLRQLRSLVYVADSGSLSRAAEILRTSQPSLSQQIKELETELGLELFLRHARGVVLTEVGHTLYAHARSILKDVAFAKETVLNQTKNPRGKVSVGFPTSVCRGLAAALIRKVGELYPNISLHIIEAMTGTLDEWMQTARLDIAVLYDPRVFANISLHAVGIEDLMLVADSKNPILLRNSIGFTELGNIPVVLPGKQHGLRNLIEHMATREGITSNVVIESDSFSAIIELVKGGYMTIMPHFAMLQEIKAGLFGAIPIMDPTPSWRLSVVVSQGTINMSSSKAVAQILIDLIGAMIKDETWRARIITE